MCDVLPQIVTFYIRSINYQADEKHTSFSCQRLLRRFLASLTTSMNLLVWMLFKVHKKFSSHIKRVQKYITHDYVLVCTLTWQSKLTFPGVHICFFVVFVCAGIFFLSQEGRRFIRAAGV